MTEGQRGFAKESLLISDYDQNTGVEILRQFNEREKILMFNLVDDFNDGINLYEKYCYGGVPKDRTGLLLILERSGYIQIEREQSLGGYTYLPNGISITSKGFRYVKSANRPGKLKTSIFRKGMD